MIKSKKIKSKITNVCEEFLNFFLKYWWISLILTLFYNFADQISTKQFVKFKEYENQIRLTKNELDHF